MSSPTSVAYALVGTQGTRPARAGHLYLGEDLDREREDVRLDRRGRQPVDSCTFKQIIFDRLENAKSRAVNGDRGWEQASLVLRLARES